MAGDWEWGREVERGESPPKATREGNDSTHHFYGGVTDQGSSAHFLLVSSAPRYPQEGSSPVSASYIGDTPRRSKEGKKGKNHILVSYMSTDVSKGEEIRT